MSKTEQKSRTDIWLEQKGEWLAQWMADMIEAYPNSSDATFLNGCLSTLENKGYVSRPQLEKVETIWLNAQDAWPEYHEQASAKNPFGD